MHRPFRPVPFIPLLLACWLFVALTGCGASAARRPPGTSRSPISTQETPDDPPLADRELTGMTRDRMPASPAPASDSLAVDSLAVDSPPVESPPIEPPPGEAPARSSEGYRIQVYSLRDQNAAIRAQQEVREGLRDLQVGVYIEEEPPYYKIRVGDYPSKADAEAVIGLLRKRYPDAWIVKTVIYLPH